MNRKSQRSLPKVAPVSPTNTVLRQLLEQGAQDPESARVDLLRELQTAKLLVPIREPVENASSGKQANLQLGILESRDGKALAGFTDVDAYHRFPAVQHLTYATMAAVDLCRFAIQGRFRTVILNPGGPIGYELAPLEFQMVAEQLVTVETRSDGALILTPDTPAVIGMPAVRPSDATLHAMRTLAQNAGAVEAYWFWLAIGNGIPHLGLAVAPPDPALIITIGEAINPIWKDARPETPLLDILPLTDDVASHNIRTQGEKLLPIEEGRPES